MSNQDDYDEATTDNANRVNPGYVTSYAGPLESVTVTPAQQIPSPSMQAGSAQPNFMPWLLGAGLLVILLSGKR